MQPCSSGIGDKRDAELVQDIVGRSPTFAYWRKQAHLYPSDSAVGY